MDPNQRWESGVSEVIGAVLLVGLVVIGGAVVASFVFGQSTPKEMPHLSFAAIKNDTDAPVPYLVLHHTGGDTLNWGDYRIIVDGDDITPVDPLPPWSLNGDLNITTNVPPNPHSVVLTFKDGSGGETVLRRLDVTDQPPAENPESPLTPWIISGYKQNVTSSGQPIGPLAGVTMRLKKTEGDFVFPSEGMVATTNGDGYYSFTVPSGEGRYSLAEEVNLTVWDPYSPKSGGYDSIFLNHNQITAERDFSNYRLPPPPKKISGHKYNVTWKGEMIGPQEGVVISLTLTSGDVPGFPSQGMTDTTDADGYYEFEVPGWWDFEIPSTLPRYCLTEVVDRNVWRPYSPSSGVRENVEPGATDQDFENERIIPPKKISGYKWGYYTTGDLIGPVNGIQIDLTLISGDLPDMQVGQTNTTWTNSSGYYEFEVSGLPAVYSLKETMDPAAWTPYMPASGMIENVPPGATNQEFKNMHVPVDAGGHVVRLEKTEPSDPDVKGHLVGGSYLQVDTKGGDHVTFGTTTFTFGNNEQVRFVINGDQDRGRLTVTKGPTSLTEFSFNITMQKMNSAGAWVDVPGASGMITDIRITNINKNSVQSNLTYEHPSYSSWTWLRLDGKDVIPQVVNGTPLQFTKMHILHDNSEGEGNNIMMIWLEPGLNTLLVEGNYVKL